MVVKKTKRKLGDLSVDEFMKSGFDSDVTDDDEEVKPSPQKDGQTDKAPHTSSLSTKKKKTSKKMKDSISVLQKADPEFYKFLEEEDKTLLEFSEDEGLDDSDSDKSDSDDSASEDGSEEENDELLKKLEAMESDSDEDFDETSEPGRNKSVHKPPDKLEVAAHVESSSDEDGDEDTMEGGSDDDSPKHKLPVKSKNLVTLIMVKGWSEKLKSTGSLKALRHLKKAFKAAVHVAGSDQGEASNYKVEGSKVFNAIVRACLSHVIPALEKALALPKQDIGSDKPVLPSASKNWRKVSADVKGYLSAVLELLSHMSETGVVDVVLKHAHRLVPYYAAFPRLARVVLKKMIGLWGSGEETSRLLAFLCIIKLLRTHKDSMLEFCLKRMYMTYVKNCKFTSPSSLPLINFMQRSLVEVLGMDVNLCYQYGFIYIRQLAIHLRNAITVKKKDNCQAVYNWQYIHCLHLWARVLSSLHPNDALQHLIYPLTETTIGVIKLLPTARYYPLRFHCVRTLNLLSASTDTFIPVLPFLLEVFEQTDFNKRHKSISLKPFNFACIIKLSKSQLVEKAFRDGVVDQLYELLLDTFTIHAHCVGFPELVLPAVIQLKDFLKKCKVANYCKQMRQVLEKVEETSRVISQRRKSAVFRLADKAAVEAWERKSKEEGTPLGKYYATWRKLRDRELQHEIAGKERLSMEFDQFPEIVRRKTPAKASAEDRKEFSELFESDSDDSGDESRFLLKEERSGPPRKKSKKGTEDSEEEDYSDFDSDELEQLAGSAGESDDDEANDSDDADEPEQMDENKDDSDGEESDDIDKEDVVKDFTFSSDED